MAIHSAQAESFTAWQKEFTQKALKQGISDTTLKTALADIKPNKEILQRLNRQSEFNLPIWQYLQRSVTSERLNKGLAYERKYRQELQKIERQFGISRFVLVAIWGLETDYGLVLNNPALISNIFPSLATLAHGSPARRKKFESELLAALKIVEQDKIPLAQLKGSWAGAMGHTQFMPSTYRRYALDTNDDGKRDIWENPMEALIASANFLRAKGWQRNQSWGEAVTLPQNFDYTLAGRDIWKPVSFWKKLGVKPLSGKFSDPHKPKASLFFAGGHQGTAFLIYPNFPVIKAYNFADSYALSVALLADAIKQGEKLNLSWPDISLPSRKIVTKIQTILQNKGYYHGKIDGRYGALTAQALRDFQHDNDLLPDGFPHTNVINKILATQ